MTSADEARGLPAECMVETAEGPVAMRQTPKKGFAVMTRMADGTIGFRQLIRLEERAAIPLLRIRLDNGHVVVVGRDHLLYRPDLTSVRARDLVAGDALDTAFRYPEGYLPVEVSDAPAAWGVHVVAVEPAGEGAVLFGTVRDTHRLYLTAGVLCGE